MPHRAPLRYAILAALALGAAPIAADDIPALADRWKAAPTVTPGIRNVLVVGITPDSRARRAFEDRFVTLLRARGGEAITSYSIVADLTAERDPAAVLGALFARRVEGVITVRLVPLDDTKAERAWAAGWRAAAGGPEPVRDHIEAGLRGFQAKADEFGVEVAFWSMDDERRIWAGRFAAYPLKTLRKRASGMVQVVIDEMRFQGLY
jgi:hypothetical protein